MINKKLDMKILKIILIFSTLFPFSESLKADFDLLDSSPSFDSMTTTNNINTSLDKYRTPQNNWGAIGQEAEIDLSEWGGKVPTCAEAPGCPVCIK